MGTVRTRHEDSEEASIDEYYGVRRRSRCGSFGSLLLGVLIFALVVMSTIGFLVATNRPLVGVRIQQVQNVLATEQEILLDLKVTALNPNALSITIADMDVSILAKSKYHLGEADKDDDTQPLLSLGHILHFDQALEFPASPFKRRQQSSIGELHLGLPGNKTGNDGSARWGRLLHHPFELYVRGVLKYSLPISSREESIEIGASVVVHPEDGVDSMGRMRVEPVDHSDHWQWIDWDQDQDQDSTMLGRDAAFE